MEVLIPVRNPTDVFQQSVESLKNQTDKSFSVLISDNFSKSGLVHLDKAQATLASAGVAARKIQPPFELGRVEHWNWLHYQSGAEWFKPLFAGDWLEPDYMASLRAAVSQEPRCVYVFCGYIYHRGQDAQPIIPNLGDGWRPPEEMRERVMSMGMQFGPPSVAAYRREAFLKAGAYDPSLPITADSLLFCKLAARHGACGLGRALAHFQIHAARFSDELPEKKREIFRETMRYFAELGTAAWHEKWRFSKAAYLRLFARQIRHYMRDK